MRGIRYRVAALVASAALLATAGCATAGEEAAAPLAGSEWRPVAIGDTAPGSDSGSFVQFRGEGQITGTGGCNRFSGTYEIDGATIRIGPLAATRRACPPPLMHREAALFAALERARRYQRARIDLTLYDEAGSAVARFARTDAD
jgi:heat shock protein HslJ